MELFKLNMNNTNNNIIDITVNNTYTSMNDPKENQGNFITRNLRLEVELNQKKHSKKPEDFQSQTIKIKEIEKEERDANGKKEDLATIIRKYKKAVRKIMRLKKLYQNMKEKRDKNIKKINNNNTKKDLKKYIGIFVLGLVFFIVLSTDFFFPFFGKSEEVKDDKEYKKEKNIGTLIIGNLFFCLIFAVLASPYTIIIIYTATRKQYISGDYLYDKEKNDDLNLLKTVQLVCGYAFSIVYCNLFLVQRTYTNGNPYFYQRIIIPDYKLKGELSVLMIVKIIIIFVSIIGSFAGRNTSIFKNDLAEYYLHKSESIYSNEIKFIEYLNEKKEVNNCLEN